MKVEGSVIVVTGASSGIGEAVARAAHARGASVVLAARRRDRLERIARELPGALVVPTDVTRESNRRALVERTLEVHGRIDTLVNNAGQGLHVPVEDVSLEGFRDILELNLVAPLHAMQLVQPHMRAQGGGCIVNISSGTSRMTLPGVGAYSATKAALNQLSQTARAEWAQHGIVVSLVLPTITATEFHDTLRQGRRRQGALPFQPQPATEVAAAVLEIIESGEPEIVLGHRRQAPA